MPLLTVKDLKLYYRIRRGPLKAVDGVSFSLSQGETLAIVGESGAGKSTVALAIMRILPKNVHTLSGAILFDGRDLLKLSERELREVRWSQISMVFQGAMEALNPVMKVGDQVAEPLIVHKGYARDEAEEEVREVLRLVGLPEQTAERYPHELSGGMKQRAVIAMALILRPRLVILDEPTSALDVITQANLMNLLKKLKWSLKLSYIFITHDLPLASELADRIAVMYAGKIVEVGTAEQVLLSPKHPYAEKLISSVPLLRRERLPDYIPGEPPDLVAPPSGCRFHPRCPHATEECRAREPRLVEVEEGHKVACLLYGV